MPHEDNPSIVPVQSADHWLSKLMSAARPSAASELQLLHEKPCQNASKTRDGFYTAWILQNTVL